MWSCVVCCTEITPLHTVIEQMKLSMCHSHTTWWSIILRWNEKYLNLHCICSHGFMKQNIILIFVIVLSIGFYIWVLICPLTHWKSLFFLINNHKIVPFIEHALTPPFHRESSVWPWSALISKLERESSQNVTVIWFTLGFWCPREEKHLSWVSFTQCVHINMSIVTHSVQFSTCFQCKWNACNSSITYLLQENTPSNLFLNSSVRCFFQKCWKHAEQDVLWITYFNWFLLCILYEITSLSRNSCVEVFIWTR